MSLSYVISRVFNKNSADKNITYLFEKSFWAGHKVLNKKKILILKLEITQTISVRCSANFRSFEARHTSNLQQFFFHKIFPNYNWHQKARKKKPAKVAEKKKNSDKLEEKV